MKAGVWGLVLFAFVCGLLTPSLLDAQQYPRSPLAAERASPQDWLPESDIKVYSDRVVLEIPNAKWATFADTNSMDPLLDKGANGIQIVPQHPEDLQIGDVITYDHDGRKIIHRIVDIQNDEQGMYYTVKGDNNNAPDPVKVRFDDIERVLVAVIY